MAGGPTNELKAIDEDADADDDAATDGMDGAEKEEDVGGGWAEPPERPVVRLCV